MKSHIIYLFEDVYILEIKCEDCFEYYIRSGNYPFEFVFGAPDQFRRPDLLRLFHNDYFEYYLEEH